MRIAVPDFVSSTFIPLIAAKELGFFREEGLDIEIVHIPALGDLEALRDGTVHFSAGPAHSPLVIFPQWRGVRLLATISQGTPWMLAMKSGLGKRGEIEAVKGCRIAVDRGPERVFRHLLRQAGIDIETDRVELVPPQANNASVSFGVAAARAFAEEKVDGLWANVLGCELATHLANAEVIIDTRRGDGPPGAGNYSFAALATTEAIIGAERERVEAVVRGLARAQSVIRHDPARAAEVARKLFPPVEAELMGRILARDADFYRPSILASAVDDMNRFATAIGLLSFPIPYQQVVATRFQHLWSV